MPELHGDASMEENEAQRHHRRRHQDRSRAGFSRFSPEIIPRGWVRCRSFTARRLHGGKRCPKAPSSSAPRQVGQNFCPRYRTPRHLAHGQHTIQIASTTFPLQSKLCGPPPPQQGPDGAPPHGTTAHTHEGSKSSIVAPMRCRAAEPGTHARSRRQATSMARAAQIGPKQPRSSLHVWAPESWPDLLMPLVGAPPRQIHASAPAMQRRHVGKGAPPHHTAHRSSSSPCVEVDAGVRLLAPPPLVVAAREAIDLGLLGSFLGSSRVARASDPLGFFSVYGLTKMTMQLT
jgi:hypothetical protein